MMRQITPEPACGREWRKLEGVLRGTETGPFWTQGERHYIIAPDATIRFEPGCSAETMVFLGGRGQHLSFNSDAFEVLWRLRNAPLRPQDLLSQLLADGLTTDPGPLNSFLAAAAEQGVLYSDTHTACSRLIGRPQRGHTSGIRSASGVPVPSAPLKVNLYLTLDCNLDCLHCGVIRDHTETLPARELSAMFDEMEDMGVCTLTLSGGEPLIHPEIKDILEDLSRRRFNTIVFTNAVPLDDEIGQIIGRSDRFVLSISLDGPSAKIHDRIRGVPGTYERVLSALTVIDRRARQTPRYFASILHIESVDLSREILDLARSLAMTGVMFLQMKRIGRAKHSPYYVSLAENPAVLADVTELMREYGRWMSVSVQGREPTLRQGGTLDSYFGNDMVCSCGILDMTIAPDGEVYHCETAFSLPADMRQAFRCGNGRDGLQSVWLGGPWDSMRGGVKLEEIAGCGSCSERQACAMKRCRIYALASAGDIRGCPAECRHLSGRLGLNVD